MKEGRIDDAVVEASFPGNPLKAEQIQRAVLKGMKFLAENGKDEEAVKAALAFKFTVQELLHGEIPISKELMTKIQDALSKEIKRD